MNKRKKMAVTAVTVFFLAVLGILALMFLTAKEETPGVLQELREKNGYIRTVGEEEYAFFEKMVYRDSTEDISEEELQQQTEAKLNRVNAEFMLANRMGLCSPYSFESFQMDMEHENTQRKLKKEKGEVFYGPVEFTLITYYDYISGNLKLDMVQFITSNADREVLKGSENYFEEFKERYRTVEKIVYAVTQDGVQETAEILYDELSTLEKTDSELFEFLYYGKEGDVLRPAESEKNREVEILSVEYEELTYKNNAEQVLKDYITNVYLENWLQELEVNFPVAINN